MIIDRENESNRQKWEIPGGGIRSGEGRERELGEDSVTVSDLH